ncbi:hypothetical protein [Actinomadura alba]|nr:hypothetical protein [Actinomadura alba]
MRSGDRTSEWLSSALRAEADRHEPDTARMRARVQAATTPRARWTPLRTAVTSLAAAGTVAAITIATWQGLSGLGREDAGHSGPVAGGSVPSSPAPHTPTAHTGKGGSTSTSGMSAPQSGSDSPVTPRSSAKHRFLTAAGAVDPNPNAHWTQENLTLETERRLVELTVSVRVARTGAVSSTGSWLTLPREDFDLAVREEPDALVYAFVLKQGRSVPPGEYTFAVQYDHAPGVRDGRLDSFSATATAERGETAIVRGGF